MYIDQGTALRTLTQTFNQEQGSALQPLFPMYNAPHKPQLWLKPVTRKHVVTNQTSTRAIPNWQERSRRTDRSTLLVLREKKVRYCLREGQLAVHRCVWRYTITYDKGNHTIIQSSGEASDHKYKIYGIIGTKASRRLSAVGSAYTCNWYLLFHIYDEFWVESRYDMDLSRCSCSTGSWRIYCRRCSNAVY